MTRIHVGTHWTKIIEVQEDYEQISNLLQLGWKAVEVTLATGTKLTLNASQIIEVAPGA